MGKNMQTTKPKSTVMSSFENFDQIKELPDEDDTKKKPKKQTMMTTMES